MDALVWTMWARVSIPDRLPEGWSIRDGKVYCEECSHA